jgi:tetratricopeptide (TPR) repeat protein
MSKRHSLPLQAVLLSATLAASLALPVAAAQHKTADLVKALEIVNDKLESEPSDRVKLLQRAALLFSLKNSEAALIDLDRILELEANNASAYFLRSNAYLSLKQYRKALSDVDQSLALSKDNTVDKLFQRANCNYMLGQDAEAIRDLDNLLKTSPLTAEQKLMSYANRAEIKYRLGQHSECLADCAKAIAIDPRGCGGSAYYWQAESAKAMKNSALAASAAIKVKQLGYVDVGRAVVANDYLVYANMFDPAQKYFHHRLDTKHFAFFYKSDFRGDYKSRSEKNRNEEWAKLVAVFAETFLTRINADLLKLDWPGPVNVYMMPDKASQHKFLQEQMNYPDLCTGTILPQRNALVFHTDSGIGTVGHVLFSQIANNQLQNDDTFSGLIAFFEKIFGYKEKGNSSLYWGYQNPWRLKLAAKSLPGLTLSDLIKLSQESKDDSQCEERLLSVFIFKKEKLKHYIELVAANDRRGYGTFLEAAFDKPLAQIEPEWHQYLLDVKKNLVKLNETPSSEFSFSKAAFDKFVGEHRDTFKDLALHASNRTSSKVDIVTVSENKTAPGVLPKGWMRSGSNPTQYEMGVDKNVTHNGTASGYIKSLTPNFKGTGTLMQAFVADNFIGKKVKLTCYTKTREVKEWAGVWMRVDGANRSGGHLAFDNMQDRPIKGTTDWTERTLLLDVPQGSATINFGILLVGGGQVWADDFAFEAVGESGKPSAKRASYINDEPLNLNFDELNKGAK